MCLDLLSVFQQLLTYIAVSPHISLGQMVPFTLLPPVPLLKRLRGHLCLLCSTDSPSGFLTKHKGGGGGGCLQGEMLQ